MEKEIWKVYTKKADFKRIGEKFGIDQVIARVIRNRDIIEDSEYDEYLFGDESYLHDPSTMKDIDKAGKIIKEAINNNTSIRIIGDYDIDGICSTYILYTGLKKLGAQVSFVVPHRMLDGYGINENLIKDAYEDNVRLIITCDNGIAAKEAIEYGKSLGMTIVVTDHHEVPFTDMGNGEKQYILPPADAVVDPKRVDCEYPFKEMCGAGISFKLIKYISGFDYKDELLHDLIEFAAIATVGDIVPLRGENRTIVKCGLRNLRKGTNNLGLRVLIECCGIDSTIFNAYHIGFIVGPCLNASGRLDTAKKAIELLLETNEEEAIVKAQLLKDFNDERKVMTEEGADKGSAEVECEYKGELPYVLVLYLQNCHESVAGIIAGRIREKFYRPTIVFTDTMEEGVLKASARSTEEYNMYEGISECKELLLKFGGHPMAAGMSMKKEKLEEFRRQLNENARKKDIKFIPVEWIDVPMPLRYISEKLIGQFSVLEPFGKANEKPVFADKNITILRANLIGKNKNVLKMTLQSEDNVTMDAVKFRASEEEIMLAKSGEKIAILYYPEINEFNNKKSLQLNIIKMQAVKN